MGAVLSLVGGVVAAIILASMSFLGILATNWQQEKTGHQQYQSDLVLRALEPDEVEEREEQLQFLLSTRLLTDEEIREGLTAYLRGTDELPQFTRQAAEAAAEAAEEMRQIASRMEGCHPSYVPCVPIVSDVDCAGGSGNAPVTTGRVTVVGPDVYDLDRDGDGIGCE